MKYVILIGYKYEWPEIAGVSDTLEKAIEIANNAINSASDESFIPSVPSPFEDYIKGWVSAHMACRIMEVPQQ